VQKINRFIVYNT